MVRHKLFLVRYGHSKGFYIRAKTVTEALTLAGEYIQEVEKVDPSELSINGNQYDLVD